jgi:dTMP kinase
VAPETGIKRASQKGHPDRFEKEKLAFHQRVRAKFLEIAKNDPARVKVIQTDQGPIAEIQQAIRAIVEEKLS